MWATKRIRLQEVRTAQHTQATKSTHLQEGPDADVMTTDSGSIMQQFGH
jgi:hypothetical protein